MPTEDDYFIADGGEGPNFGALPGNAHFAFVNISVGGDPKFPIGGQFGGRDFGTLGLGGIKNHDGTAGPLMNSYSKPAGVLGTSNHATGVAGTSVDGVGVYGQTEEVDLPFGAHSGIKAGVLGVAKTQPGILGWASDNDGIQGFSPGYAGVRAVSHFNSGVVASAGLDGPEIPNAPNIAGVCGSSDTQPGVIGTSNTNIGVYGYSNNVGIVGETTNPASYAGYFVGDVVINGTLTATVKNAVVTFPDRTQRLLHCMESPEHWFEDFGTARLKRGRVVVKLDVDFAKVIKSADYRVFVTPEGDCAGLYVRRKSAASFEVCELMGGKSSAAFSYRIVGRRRDIKAHQRFAKAETRLPMPTTRVPRSSKLTPAALRTFIARMEKQARGLAPKSAKRGRRGRVRPERAGYPVVLPPHLRAKKT